MQTQQQDIKNQLARFGEILEANKEDLTQRSRPRPTPLHENITRTLPPLTIPLQKPDEIITKYFTKMEKEALVKYLSSYQKTRPDWDQFRNTMPDELLDKWTKILKECRENGFVSPRVDKWEIVWSQILGFKRNYKCVDKCSLCSSSQRAGDCKGTTKYKLDQRMFQPCWEVRR